MVVKPAYDVARSFHDGVAAVQAGKSWHLVGASGARIGAQDYEQIGEFSRGLALVQSAAGDVYVDKTGTAVFWAGLLAQALVFTLFATLDISYLWYNVIGCMACLAFSLMLQAGLARTR